MSNTLNYKGYTTSVEYDAEDSILYGKVDGIRSRILFDSSEADTIVEAFHQAVDDYLDACEENGVEPEKPYKGSFNVRIDSDLHRRSAHYATSHGTTLNKVVQLALRQYLQANDINETASKPEHLTAPTCK